MAVEWEFDVREIPREQQRTDYKDFFRVYVSPAIMQSLGLGKGDPCKLKILGRSVGTVLVWETNKGIKTKEIQIPKRLLSIYAVNSYDKVSLSKMSSQLPNATSVTLCETRLGDSRDALLEPSECAHWAWLLEYELYRAETISPGMVFEEVVGKGQKRSFKIQYVDGSRTVLLYRIQADCNIHVVNEETQSERKELVISQGDLGGLETQIKKLNECIASYSRVENVEPKARSSPQWANGIMLHGPPGAGKSLLLHKVGEAGWRTVFNFDADPLRHSTRLDEKIAMIRRLFKNARSAQPSVIMIDDLTDFINTHDPQLSAEALAVSRVLRQEMGNLGDSRTLVVATASTLTNMQQGLMTVDGFSERIEIPVPDTHSRALILKAQSGIPANEDNPRIKDIACRTHGFVAADLVMLLDVAFRAANTRAKLDGTKLHSRAIDRVWDDDVDFALRKVKPAAIRGVFVEIPETRWSDIGGQQEVKDFLDRALCRPSKASRF